MRVYRLEVPLLYRIFVFGILAFMTLIVPFLFLWNLGDLGAQNGPPGFLMPMWLLIMAWNWSVVLRLPHQIRVRDNGLIEFVSLVRTTSLSPQELISLKPLGLGGGFFILKHTEGKLRLLLQFTGLHEFLSIAKAANPRFETRGC